MAALYALVADPATGAAIPGVRRSDGAFVPPDPGNIDWQAYQAWVAAGDTPDPAPTASAVPAFITNYQGRAQMIADGHFDAVDQVVRGSGNATAIAAWDYANVFYRDSAFITTLQGGTPYNTAALVDALFVAASAIT